MRILFILLIFGINASILTSQEDKPFSYKDDRELFERVVRAEEALVNMQKTLTLLLQQIDKRFEEMLHQMDKRFEQVEKRFDTLYWILGIAFMVIMGVLGLLFRMILRIEREITYLGNSIKTPTNTGYQGSIQKKEPDYNAKYN